MFVPEKLFQPNLMFVNKAGAYRGIFHVLSSRVGSWYYLQTLD
jgi:hypothetical protein